MFVIMQEGKPVVVTYRDVAKGAIAALAERGGSTFPVIKKYLDMDATKNRFLKTALTVGVKSGWFIENKGKYRISKKKVNAEAAAAKKKARAKAKKEAKAAKRKAVARAKKRAKLKRRKQAHFALVRKKQRYCRCQHCHQRRLKMRHHHHKRCRHRHKGRFRR